MTNAALLMLVLATLAEAAAAVVSPGRGIPETLATERAANIRALRYELSFRIPDSKAEVLHGVETMRFELRAPRQVVLDFEQKRVRIVSVKAGEKAVAFDFVDGHIIVPATAIRAGENAAHGG
jgi:aminopeptidase N